MPNGVRTLPANPVVGLYPSTVENRPGVADRRERLQATKLQLDHFGQFSDADLIALGINPDLRSILRGFMLGLAVSLGEYGKSGQPWAIEQAGSATAILIRASEGDV